MAKKVEKLLLVDEDYTLTGLITIKDIDMMRRFPQACKDGQGRLRVGAAVGVYDYERAESLIGKGRRRPGGRQRPRAFGQRDRDGQGDQEALGYRRRCRQRGNGRGMPRSDRRRGRRGEGGHRAGIDLHDAGDFGRRRAADHGDLRGRPGGRRHAGVRSSPTAAFAIRATSPRRLPRGPRGDDRRAVRRAWTRAPANGCSTRAERSRFIAAWVRWGPWSRVRASATGRSDGDAGNGKLVPEGVEGRVPYKGPLRPVSLPAGRRAAGRNGLLRHENNRTATHGRAIHPGLAGQCAGESSP